MRPNLKYLLLFLSFSVCLVASASRIDRAYEALHQFDYFKAKQLFEKGLKYSECPAAQGLAIIYYRKDNPFHNYDSALVYIQRSIEGWDMYKAKKKEKYRAYGFTEDSLLSTREMISSRMYEAISKIREVSLLTSFIDEHKWALERSEAIAIRDSVAFFQAVSTNSSKSYKEFAETYSGSTYSEMAMENFYELQFQEQTQAGDLTSFESFVSKNPSSPLKPEAEKRIYNLVTERHTKEVYQNFIRDYSSNMYVDTAWINLFQLSVSDYSKEALEEFLMSYPETSIKSYVEERISLIDSICLPYLADNKYGLMSIDGIAKTPAVYEYIGPFKEGCAIVAYKDRYGFIDKTGATRVPMIFDAVSELNSGMSIVEMDEKVGMIDRNGHYLFDVIYDDLSAIREELCYAELDGKYGYYSNRGELAIPHEFDDAYGFEGGLAKVEKDEKQAFIDRNGNLAVPFCYDGVEQYYDTLFTFEEDGLVGIMNHRCQMFVEPMYSYIGSVKNGLALAEIDDRVVYLDSLGQLVIDNDYEVYPNYMFKGEFDQKFPIVYKEGKYGRINAKGKEVTPLKLENVGRGDKYYPAQIKGKWGLFNGKNEEVVKAAYHSVDLIDDRYIVVSRNDTLAMLDVTGKTIIPQFFESIVPVKENLFIVKQNEKVGVYNGSQLVVPVAYNQIGMFDADFLYLSKEGVLEYYCISQDEVIRKKEDE